MHKHSNYTTVECTEHLALCCTSAHVRRRAAGVRYEIVNPHVGTKCIFWAKGPPYFLSGPSLGQRSCLSGEVPGVGTFEELEPGLESPPPTALGL